jgi:uncharacterized protein YqgC (DUF456 family)
MTTVFLAIAAILAVAGIVGCIIPVIPGTPLNYIALLILHYAYGGDVFGITFLIVFGMLTALSVALDYLLPLLGAKMYGASRYAMVCSTAGMILGFVVFSFIGMVLGMLLGAVVGEVITGKKGGEALRSGAVTFAGSLVAAVLKSGLSLVMAASFFVKLFQIVMG